MRFRTVFRGSPPLLLFQSQSSWRFFSQLRSRPERSSFGIAFDIDGVILRGRVPIGGSPQSLRRLYGDSGTLKIPFLFLTNGGGIPESRRASELSNLLGVKILPSQVVQGHSPFKGLLKRKVLSLDEYAAYFDNIDPVSQYKNWTTEQAFNRCNISMDLVPRYNVFSDRVKAAFVISDPVDWGRDIQVLCDILRSGGLPAENNGHQPALYFAADDLEYQAAFPAKRLGMGAFRIALESIFNRIHHSALEYTSFGKPNPFVFKNAETILRQIQASCHDDNVIGIEDMVSLDFKTLYMIGDNPVVDIKGAQQAGHPWFSILTRTGVFREKENHAEFPADLVVDTVEEAVEYIMSREGNA
ncbi:uncharacterized protein YKR070W-like isoform X3 [Camellia sinensis]|uniref:uncharacterized protein YKR070W-like isoform X3 n=1 Tax=Camellia sinensis TaxID=4442 RepID=UPI001036A64F|nr:uncharacterized protein YKR070W-like isoform X3 [Camellia sinensis]